MIFKESEISDFLVTALEGGSNYWYNLADLSMIKPYRKQKEFETFIEPLMRALVAGVEVPVYDIEEQEEEDAEPLGILSWKTIEEAEHLLIEKYPHVFGNLKAESYDAEDGDIWFQLVVLKDVIYG